MKKFRVFRVDVHMDIVAHLEVSAKNEEEAVGLAEDMAKNISLSNCDCMEVESCICY